MFIDRHMKIKKPEVHFIIKIFLIENQCKTPPLGVLHSFSIKNIFHDKMDFFFFMFIDSLLEITSDLLTS